MMWVLVPFSRPDYLQNVRENFDRQTMAGKKLCIVENGAAIGACKQAGFEPDLLLTSEAHPSLARNAGLVALRDLDAHFSCMDDDDFYGPEYQWEHFEHAKRGRVTGKMPHWVRFEAVGKLWLFNRERANRKVSWVQGPTIGGFARDVPDFPLKPIGEDVAFCRVHREAGGEVFNTSVGNFLYVRRSDEKSHAYRIGAVGFADEHGPWFEEHPDDITRVFCDNPQLGARKAYNQI